jgi:hypothetical protein
VGASAGVALEVLHDDGHGLMEGATEDDDEEVNGVAALVGVEPAPVCDSDSGAGLRGRV